MTAARTRPPIPATLRPEWITAIIDTREQLPLDLSPLRTTTATLPTGDYSIQHLEHIIAVERKSLSDLLSCIGTDRQRFDREVMRLLAYPVRALVVESDWQTIEAGDWHSQVTASAAVGSCLGWIASGLPVVMCGSHARAGRYVARLLFTAARRRWREARSLVDHAMAVPTDNGITTSSEGGI